MGVATHIALGLTDEEFEEIKAVLGRTPNHLELAMYSVMWSEHCSYKSSRIHLGRFPTTGDRVIMGPGENAGVIDVGEGFAVAIRMESHNHPSAIEPYQGAATGVGGILRDIFTVGARPIALLDSLWMGPQDDPRNQWVFKGVVSGISGYGNAVGVPTVGGEISFRPRFGANPLVNVAAVGVAPRDRLVWSNASGVGNQVVLLGSSTGRDGIGGVSILASAGFESESDGSKRPSVQVGDPFEEKKLIEACLELLDRKLVVGIQDLGGAGLSCATSETAAKGGNGMDVYLDTIPLREAGMEPFEIMTSESQERMLAIVEPSRVAEVLAIAGHWEITATVIGEVRAPGEFMGRVEVGVLRIFENKGGELLAAVPAASLADEAPLYRRPMAEPTGWTELKARSVRFLGDRAALREYVVSSSFEPSWIYRQYDHQLFLNTIVGPGADAALLAVGAPGAGRAHVAIGLSVDGNPGWCAVDPFHGALATVVESALNVAAVGTEPVALVDCLNFGNPNHPEVMWQLSRAIDGISEACRALGIAVVGGNVSLYNEADGEDIEPTPSITTIGVRPLPESAPPTFHCSEGDTILLLGSHASTLAGSDLVVIGQSDIGGELFRIDLAVAKRLVEMTVELSRSAEAHLLSGLHNVASGGLVGALLDLARSSGVGFEVPQGTIQGVEEMLGEEPMRVLAVTSDPDAVRATAAAFDIPSTILGVMKGASASLAGWFDIALAEIS